MSRRKRCKRINYHGRQCFEGDATRALALTPQDYGFADLDEIAVVGNERWKSERDNFSYSLTATIHFGPRSSHYCETSICPVKIGVCRPASRNRELASGQINCVVDGNLLNCDRDNLTPNLLCRPNLAFMITAICADIESLFQAGALARGRPERGDRRVGSGERAGQLCRLSRLSNVACLSSSTL
jgi:hypothetical protein